MPHADVSYEGEHSHSDQLEENYEPHDYRILDVINSLGIQDSPETIQPDQDDTLLVRFAGRIQYFNKARFEQMFNQMVAQEFMPNSMYHRLSESEADALGVPQYAGKTNKDLYQAMITFLPSEPSLVLTLHGNRKRFLMPLQEQYMRYPPNYLNALFPSGLIGKWDVVAYMPATSAGFTEPRNFLESLVKVFRSANSTVNALGFPSDELLPILVSREIAV